MCILFALVALLHTPGAKDDTGTADVLPAVEYWGGGGVQLVVGGDEAGRGSGVHSHERHEGFRHRPGVDVGYSRVIFHFSMYFQ